MTTWTPDTWHAAVSRSPFVETATYDGAHDDRPRVDRTATGGLLWLELENRGAA